MIVPLFSRKRRPYNRLPRQDFSRGTVRLHHQYQERFLYHKRCEQLRTIIFRECIQLKQAVIKGQEWTPYLHPWRHDKRC